MTIGGGAIPLLDLMLIPGIRAGGARRLLAQKQTKGWGWDEFWSASEPELISRFGVPPKSARWIANKRDWILGERQRVLTRLRGMSAFVVTSEDAAYPEALRRMPDYPPLLVMKGNPSLLDREKMGLLSSRNPSWRDVSLIGSIILGLRDRGVAIVSGAGAIQHYVPGYWGLLAEVPVIWVLDRGMLTAYRNHPGEHLAPLARIDGLIWNEEFELAISPFSPEDVGTPGGLLLRDRVIAWLSDTLVGWGLRANGNAIKALRERYKSGGRVITFWRKEAPSCKMVDPGVPTLFVSQTSDEWKNCISRREDIPQESQMRLERFIHFFLSDPGGVALIDVDWYHPEPLESRRENFAGKLWLRGSRGELRKSSHSPLQEIELFPGHLWMRMSRVATRVLLVTGDWNEMIPIGKWVIYGVGAKLTAEDEDGEGVREPVRDYMQSPEGYRKAHAKMRRIWRQEILRIANSGSRQRQLPRAVAAVMYLISCISLEKELIWVFPSDGRPDWVPGFCGALGLTQSDGSEVPEGWETWVRLGRFGARSL